MRSLVSELPFDWATGRRLLPAGALTAVGASIYGVATTVYMPRLMQSNSERYRLFGVTLSLVGWLLCIALIMVAATVVAAEFDRAPEIWAHGLRALLGLEQATRPAAAEPVHRPTMPSSGDGHSAEGATRRP